MAQAAADILFGRSFGFQGAARHYPFAYGLYEMILPPSVGTEGIC